jgi:hypothetical protein
MLLACAYVHVTALRVVVQGVAAAEQPFKPSQCGCCQLADFYKTQM